MAKPKGDIPLNAIVELKLRNPEMTLKEAGKVLGCTGSNIATRLTAAGLRWSELSAEVDRFRSVRADLLASVQRRVLSELTGEKLKKANAQQLVTVFGILYDKERLERGKSINDQALYVVLVERSHRKNYLEGGAKIIDAEAENEKQIACRAGLTDEDREGQEDSEDS